MQQTKEALFAKGTTGQTVFLLRWILTIIPVATLIFSIYYMAISISGIWKSANGANIFVGNLFFAILTLGSIVLALFMTLGIMQTTNTIRHFYVIDTTLAFIVGFIILSLATEQKFSLYTENIVDYCIRNPSVEFCTENDRHSIEKYVRTRTTAAYSALSGVLAPWVVFFIVFLITLLLMPDDDPGTPRRDLDQNLKQERSPTLQSNENQSVKQNTEHIDGDNLAIKPNEEEEYSAYSYGGVDEEELIEKRQIKVAEV